MPLAGETEAVLLYKKNVKANVSPRIAWDKHQYSGSFLQRVTSMDDVIR